MPNFLAADNARCLGAGCPRRETCLRYLCSNDRGILSFAAFEPEHCDYYLEANTNERISTNDE